MSKQGGAMQISVEKTKGLERKLSFSVSTADIGADVHKRLQKMAREVKIDGFRPGKVPFSVVEKRYAEHVRGDALQDLAKEKLFTVIDQEKLQPVSMPHVHHHEENDLLNVTATFEVYPEIVIGDLSHIKLEKISADITDSDVDAALEKLREKHSDWVAAERAAKEGDQVVLDFTGTVEGEDITNGGAKDYTVELGSHSMIPGFEEGLIGLKAGDSKELTLSFPEKYHAEHLAGKPAVFAITVKAVKESIKRPLDDTFAELFGITEGGLAKLREEIRQNLEVNLKTQIKNNFKSALFEKLLAANPIELPTILIDREVQAQQKELEKRFGKHEKMNELLLASTPHFEEEARRRVGLGLLFQELIKHFDIKLDQEKVQKAVEEISQKYQQPEEMRSYILGNKERLENIKGSVLEDQVIEKIESIISVNEKKLSYDEFMEKTTEPTDSN